MPLAASSYSYPLLGAFWTILEIFLWVLWIWVLIYVFIDIFRSHDLSGWAKALWFIFVLFIPLIGVLVYLIARGRGMQERKLAQMHHMQHMQEAYIKQVAGTSGGGGGTGGKSASEQIAHAKELLDAGAITPQEYDALKAKALA